MRRNVEGGCAAITRESDHATQADALRAEAIAGLDLVLQASPVLRAQLRSFERAVRRERAHLARGGAAADLHEAFDIAAVREALLKAADELETARRNSRLAIFVMQQSEGRSASDISRGWGLSRQLVSRSMKDAQPD